MAIVPISELPIADGFGENDTLILNTENGVKQIKAGDVGGGNEEPQAAFVVSLTLDENTGTYNSNKTGAEIYEAWSNNIPINIRVAMDGVPVEIPAITMMYDPHDGYQVAGGVSIAMQGSRNHEMQFFTIMGAMNSGDDTGPWSLDIGTEQLLPQPNTPGDDGKFLVADSNGWGMQRVDTSKSLVVTLTEVSGQEDVYSANKTASEIYSAYTSNTPVYLKTSSPLLYPLISAEHDSKYSFTAALTYIDDDVVTMEMFAGEFNSGSETSGWEYVELTAGDSGESEGDAGYTVTFSMDCSNQNMALECDKEIDDIIDNIDNHISGRLIMTNIPIDGAQGVTFDIYCDNMKFDYQKMVSTDSNFDSMVPTYTYLGFVGDFGIGGILNGEPADNGGPHNGYYKNYVVISWLFDEEEPSWSMEVENAGGSDEIYDRDISLTYPDYSYGFGEKVMLTLLASPDQYGGNATATYPGRPNDRIENFILDRFMPPELTEYSGGNSYHRTALYSPLIQFNNQWVNLYNKPAQIEVHVNGTAVETGFYFDGIFTIDKCSIDNNSIDGSSLLSGFIEMHMDEDDSTNNRIIKHIIHMEIVPEQTWGFTHPVTTYKRVAIPYTVI